jgi:hypothetical protein
MRHHTKTWTFLLVLLAFTAGTVPVWSQQNQATKSSTIPSSSAKPTAPVQELASADSSAATENFASAQDEKATPTQETGASRDNSELPTSPSTANAAQENTAARHAEFDPAATIAKPLWTVTRWIGDFNPIGNHVASPLESWIRGFRFKGYINNVSEVNTTSTDHDYGLTHRNKDWRLQKQEERVQAELRYQATEQLEFVNVNNFQFDGAYALEVGQGAPTATPNTELYTQGKRIFKEAYLRGNYGKINFTFGKQIVNWGKFDGKVIDIVNADDERDGPQYHQGDYEWRYQGQFMGLLSIRPRAKTNISFLWNPDFQTNVGTAPGSPWSLFNYAPPTSGPEVIKPYGLTHIGQSEAGVRVDNSFGALTVSEIYYSGFNRAGPDPGLVDGAYHFTRENKYGYALDYGTNLHGQRFVLRSEGLFTQGQQLPDAASVNGEIKKNLEVFGGAVETSVGKDANKVDFLYEALWYRTPGVDGARTHQDIIHVLDVAHSFRSTSDRLNIEATFYVDKGGSTYGGWAAQYQTGWRFNDYIVASVCYNDYQGGSTPETLESAAPFGAFRKWRNVETRIKYEF